MHELKKQEINIMKKKKKILGKEVAQFNHKKMKYNLPDK